MRRRPQRRHSPLRVFLATSVRMLRMRRIMYRWHWRPRVSLTVAVSPARRLSITSPTSFGSHSIGFLMNHSRLVWSSFVFSVTLTASRRPVSSAPMTTGAPDVSAFSPRMRLRCMPYEQYGQTCPRMTLFVELPHLLVSCQRGICEGVLPHCKQAGVIDLSDGSRR